ETAVKRGNCGSVKGIFTCAITDSEDLDTTISGNTIKEIKQPFRKGGIVIADFGLIDKDLRLRCKARNQLNVHRRFTSTRARLYTAVNLNVLNSRCGDTDTSGIICDISGIVWLAKFGDAN